MILFAFFLPTSLCFGSHQSTYQNGIYSLTKKKIFYDNLNDILNDGINITTFMELFNGIPFFDNDYDQIIDTLTNQSFNFVNDQDIKIFHSNFLSYLNFSATLSDINPIIHTFLSNNKNQFINLQPIISELGPHLCKVINVDYDSFYKLYNYVFINPENDGIIFQNIINILQIPGDLIQKITSFLSFFEQKRTVSYFFAQINCLPQYYTLIEKLKAMKIPRGSNNRFFSVPHIIDCLSSLVDLIDAIYNNFILKNIKDFSSAKYLLKPFNFAEFTIYDRIDELIKAINIVQNYSYSCSTPGEEAKCTTYNFINFFLKTAFCSQKVFTCTYDDAFVLLKGAASSVLLTRSLPRDANLYLDILKGFVTFLPDDGKRYTFGFFMKQPLSTIVKNVTRAAQFMLNYDEASNLKQFWDDISLKGDFDIIRNFVRLIGRNESVCEIFNLNGRLGGDCHEFAKARAKMLLTDKTYAQVFEDRMDNLSVFTQIQIFKSLSLNVSEFVSFWYNVVADKELVQPVSFQRVVRDIGSLFEKILAVAQKNIVIPIEWVPRPLKKYVQFAASLLDLRGVVDVIKNDQKILNLFYRVFGRYAAVIELIVTGASAYVDDNTTISEMVKSMGPSNFLNVHQTLLKFSQIENMNLTTVAAAVTIDGGSKFTLDDMFPIKTLARNMDKFAALADEMDRGCLFAAQIAECAGVEKEKVVRFIGDYLLPFMTFLAFYYI